MQPKLPNAAEVVVYAEPFESRLLLSPTVGLMSFSVTEYGYGSAVGELTGAITGGSGNEGAYTLEVDIGNDGSIDWTDGAPSSVPEIWAQITLPYGTSTKSGTEPVAVRLTETEFETNTVTTGPWTVQDITVDPPSNAAPALANLTYTPWDYGYGFLGYLSGEVVDSTQGFGTYELQVDVNGDGTPDSTYASADLNTGIQTFVSAFQPQVGQQTVYLRLLEQDVNTGAVLEGGWASLTFTPALPANQGPEIAYLQFFDSGYGGMGEVLGEFSDYTREESNYVVQVDRDGDGQVDFSATQTSNYQFSADSVTSGSRFRVVETDMFGREFVSPWVGPDMGQPNHPPTFPPGPNSFTLASSAVQNGQNVGTVTATDPDGDTLKYKLIIQPEIVPVFQQIAVPRIPRPGVSVDEASGAITIADATVVQNAFQTNYQYGFSIEASDGKQTTTTGVTLYDNYQVYLNAINAYISQWRNDADALAIATAINAKDALYDVDAFGSIESFTGTVGAIANLTWAATAYGAPPAAGHAAVATVATQILINAVAAKADQGHAAIIQEMQDEINAVRDQDLNRNSQTEANENAAVTQLIADITNLSPDQQTKKVVEHLNSLKARLPDTPGAITPPAVDNIYAELLLSYTQINGWSINGSMWAKRELGAYWYTWAADGPWTDVTDVRDELNRLGYTKGQKYSLNP